MSATPLQDLIENEQMRKQVLSESQVSSYEYYLQTTSNQDVTNQTNYVLQNLNAGNDLISDLSNAFLMVQWYITTAAGAGLDITTTVPVVSLTKGAWSLFKNVRLEISGEIIDSISDPGTVHNVLTKASKDVPAIRSMANDEFYYPAGMPLDTTNSLTVSDTNFAIGMAKIRTASAVGGNGLWSKLYLRDVLGFTNQRKLFPNMSWILRLDKETTYANCLMRSSTGPNADMATKITCIQLWVPALKVKDTLATKYFSLEALRSEPVPLDWMKISYMPLPFTASTALQNRPIFSGVRAPRYLFAAVQSQSYTTQQLDSSGGNSGAYGLGTTVTSMFITVNGKKYPFVEYNAAATQYIREVEMLRTAFNKNLGSPIFNKDNFATFNSIYYFDFSHNDNLYEENSSDKTIQVYAQTASSEAFTVHCVYLSEMHQKLQLIGSTLHVASATN